MQRHESENIVFSPTSPKTAQKWGSRRSCFWKHVNRCELDLGQRNHCAARGSQAGANYHDPAKSKDECPMNRASTGGRGACMQIGGSFMPGKAGCSGLDFWGR